MVMLTPPLLLHTHAAGATESAPWWGVPVVAGVFLLIGAVVAHQFNNRQEDRKAERSLAERYMDQRLEYCSNLLDAARTVKDILGKGGTWPQVAPEFPHVSDEVKAARSRIQEACREAMSSYSSITLIAPETLRKPSRHVVVSLMQARALNTSQQARDTHKRLSATIQQFEAAARKHFGAGEEEASQHFKKKTTAEQTRRQKAIAWLNEPL